ncbi:unnamed protein product [Polarella glacialis]|uniref:V-type proton ATPase subunit G n=2 Tax=Polarella glacialis TaxID=89957 RepID=A0A813INN3_POLGL|nr:unnamed protein product [Polarella glacialis]CAE8653003.1 unnamed protein product [Polarella glacialis]
MAAVKSQELIQQLLVAEKQADEIIANAKKNRLTKLKQAREKADEELKDFREKEEAKFQKEMAVKARADPNESLKVTTAKEIEKVVSDYDSNKARCIEFVVGKVLDVATSLSSTQKQALQTNTV